VRKLQENIWKNTMTEIKKKETAIKILNLLNITFSNKESFNSLLNKIRTAIVLPGSDTEGEIMVLCIQIADELNKIKPDENTISTLYQKLEHEVTYLPFD
jgi:hypothetical protein